MTAPKPAGPDPAAVRAALAEIDAAFDEHEAGNINDVELLYRLLKPQGKAFAAARAWLEQQETNDGP